jgi:flavin-dependent dehydrogenase
MERRGFIHRLFLTSGAVVLGTHCSNPDRSEEGSTLTGPAFESSTGDHIIEPRREIPVVDRVDVLVVGGGPSGVAAALSASRAGASTLLLERYNHLGGLWTGGLVLPLLSTHGLDKNNRQVKAIHGISDEIHQRLKTLDMSVNEVNPVIDPEAAKYVLEVMLKEAGVKVYYHSWASNVLVEDHTLRAVIMETKSGRVAVRPKVVIDCTGDGDVLHWAGEDYLTMNYEIGLVHRLGNVDRIDRNAPGYKEL